MNTPYPARQVIPAWRNSPEANAAIDATSSRRNIRRAFIAEGLPDPGPNIDDHASLVKQLQDLADSREVAPT